MKYQLLIVSAILAFLTVSGGDAAPKSSYNAQDEIQAEDYSYAYESQAGSGAQLYCSDNNTVYVGYNIVSAYLQYNNVDFGSGVQILTMRLSSWIAESQVGFINLHVDDMNKLPFARFPVRTTSPTDYCHFLTVTEFLQGFMSGVHTLFFTFSQPSGQPFVNIDSFRFKCTTTTA